MIDLRQGDCLELMKDIPDKSIDMILCDLPYGTTACKWDIVIPFDKLWEQYNRIIKDNGAIVLFGNEPFSSKLRVSNINHFKYDWIWQKTKPSGHLNAKKQPLRKYETKNQYKLEWCHKHREERQAYKTMYGRKRKEKLILLKGGKCQKCGVEYNGENSAIFDFHHIDKSSKKFILNTKTLICYSWEKIVNEAEKCELLCSNCHRLHHFWDN